MILPKARDQYNAVQVDIGDLIDEYLSFNKYETEDDKILIKLTPELCIILTDMDYSNPIWVNERNNIIEMCVAVLGSYVKPLADDQYSYDIKFMYKKIDETSVNCYFVLTPVKNH